MNQELDIRACRRLLMEIADLCDHASLTGSLSSGSKRTAERYNAVLTQLVESKNVPNGLFSRLPDVADFGEVGVEARMLAGYLSGDSKGKDKENGGRSVIIRLAPFIGQAELSQLVRDYAKAGEGLDINTITALAPFLGQEHLSALVRESMLKKESQPSSPTPPTTTAARPPSTDTTPERLEPNEQGVGHLLDMLQDSSLSERERQHVIERIRIATSS